MHNDLIKIIKKYILFVFATCIIASCLIYFFNFNSLLIGTIVLYIFNLLTLIIAIGTVGLAAFYLLYIMPIGIINKIRIKKVSKKTS